MEQWAKNRHVGMWIDGWITCRYISISGSFFSLVDPVPN